MSDSDSIGSSISSDSEFSDCDSRDESPSSGYVDDESASVRSVSTANSDSKKKKKVTFQCDENLVLIREIPARSLLGRWTLESDSESEVEEEGPRRAAVAPQHCIAKGNYEVKKSTGKVAAKVAAITGATLPTKPEGKRTARKRLVKKEKRKEIASENTNETEESSKPKGKNSRVKGGKKHGSKGPKAKSNERREQKEGEGPTAPNKTMTSQTEYGGPTAFNKTVLVTSHTDCGQNRSMESTETTTTSTIAVESREFCLTEPRASSAIEPRGSSATEHRASSAKTVSAMRIVDLLDDSYDRDSNPIKQIEKVYIVEENYSQNSRDFLDAMIQSSDRLDVRAMSKTNRRLYSWLMANGNIPNPQQESPCIAPMWDSSCGAAQGPHNSIVRAPT